jgi:hypothetical protein
MIYDIWRIMTRRDVWCSPRGCGGLSCGGRRRTTMTGGGGVLLIGRRATSACEPGGGEVAGDLGAVAPEKKGKEGRGADARGPWQREKGREERAARGQGKNGADKRARAGSEGGGERWLLGFGKEFGPGKGEEERSPREREKDLGRRWPTREEERRPEREKRSGAGWALFFSFSLFQTQSIHTNPFEFKQCSSMNAQAS